MEPASFSAVTNLPFAFGKLFVRIMSLYTQNAAAAGGMLTAAARLVFVLLKNQGLKGSSH